MEPLSMTRGRRHPPRPCSPSPDSDSEPATLKPRRSIAKRRPHKKKKQQKQKKRLSADEKSANVDLFWRYLHRRMCVRVQMHGDTNVLGKNVPEPPFDYILDLAKSGNAYRHLDTEDHAQGKELLDHFRLKAEIAPSDEDIEKVHVSLKYLCLPAVC